jgi:formylmethanofuran dehydrogenase subunit E
MTRIVKLVVAKCDYCGEDFECDPWWARNSAPTCDNCLETQAEDVFESALWDKAGPNV